MPCYLDRVWLASVDRVKRTASIWRFWNRERVAKELQLRLGLKVDVRLVELGSLPRFEGKGKRFLDQR